MTPNVKNACKNDFFWPKSLTNEKAELTLRCFLKQHNCFII